jgi:hypothetical protein
MLFLAVTTGCCSSSGRTPAVADAFCICKPVSLASMGRPFPQDGLFFTLLRNRKISSQEKLFADKAPVCSDLKLKFSNVNGLLKPLPRRLEGDSDHRSKTCIWKRMLLRLLEPTRTVQKASVNMCKGSVAYGEICCKVHVLM